MNTLSLWARLVHNLLRQLLTLDTSTIEVVDTDFFDIFN